MFRSLFAAGLLWVVLLTIGELVQAQDASAVRESVVPGPAALNFKIRLEGPYTAEVPLQIVCYFKYSPQQVQKMAGAPVELDRHLGGMIASLRERGEFVGDALETLVIACPANTIKAKRLMLIGLGDEQDFSLELMEDVGRTALRQAISLKVTHVAFAPLIRDQGNDQFSTGKVENAVIQGVLLAYDTELKLQKEGLSPPHRIAEWRVEAGPNYFDETVQGVKQAIAEAAAAVAKRPANSYRSDAK